MRRFIAQSEGDPPTPLWLGVRARRNLNSIPASQEEAVGLHANHNPPQRSYSRIRSSTSGRRVSTASIAPRNKHAPLGLFHLLWRDLSRIVARNFTNSVNLRIPRSRDYCSEVIAINDS